ncbi:MAG: ROK family protein, partial [Phycisphaeraceae bacterium]|nr:ROK family protein [Phycisphaeraceae bacterium]
PDVVLDDLAEVASAVAADAGLELSGIEGIGVGAPGPMDFERGLILNAPNLPGWENVALRDRLAEATGRPVTMENDANAAAFGEFWAGAGGSDQITHMVMYTLGTGIGTGLVIDNRIIRGAFGVGGEGGHTIVNPDGPLCGCGQRGCLEVYAAASRVAEHAVNRIKAGADSSLAERIENGDDIGAEDVFAAAADGDEVSETVIEQATTHLGIACVNICRLLDPQMIVFAGGMIAAGDALFGRIRTAYDKHHWTMTESHVEIVPAQLGNHAGVIGAAGVAWQERSETS